MVSLLLCTRAEEFTVARADLSMSEFHLHESTPLSRTKPHPKLSGQFYYAPSDDGTDENLLIFLHGLGDTHLPFSKLGRSLRLPQTATLSLRAPEKIPFLYEDAYQWYPSFDGLGEIIESPNPTPAFRYLDGVIDHLTKDCQWSINRMHFLGFAQGGSVAAEFVLERWKAQLVLRSSSKVATLDQVPQYFASVVSISGPLLSYPTLSETCPTPVCVAHRLPQASSPEVSTFKKAFSSVTESRMGTTNDGMPASRAEWQPVMRFWSESLATRAVDGLYQVMTGSTKPG